MSRSRRDPGAACAVPVRPRLRPPTALVLVLALWLVGLPAAADVIHVPEMAPTIQSALGFAQPGDVVQVAPGTYLEHDLVVPDGVTLQGTGGGMFTTTIDAQHLGRVLAVTDPAAQSVVIRDLTLRHGEARRGGALLIAGQDVTVENVFAFENRADYGGGIYVEAGTTSIAGCLLGRNVSRSVGGGLLIRGESTDVTLERCVIVRNEAAASGGAWHAAMGARLTTVRCTVADNRAALGREGSAFDADAVAHDHCVASRNVADSGLPDPPYLPDDPGPAGALLVDVAGVPQYGCTVRSEGWPGPIASQEAVAGNVTADPLFCGTGEPVYGFAQYYGVAADSPCLPENSPAGCTEVIGALDVACDQAVGTPEGVPDRPCVLHAPAPNPFNPSTTIRFAIRDGGPVRLEIFDLSGRKVATLVDGSLPPGAHEAAWRGRDDAGRRAASGVYVCRLVADGTRASQRLTLVK